LILLELSQKINGKFDLETLKQYNTTNKIVTNYNNLLSKFNEIFEFIDIFGDDEESYITDIYNDIRIEVDRFYLESMFSEIDKNNAVVSINSGAGGLEAQDWASMIFWMYYRWATKHKYSVDLLDIVNNSNKGIKSVDFIVSGEYSYGYLKQESGVHRLIRNSPFDSNNSRHTSFCSVFISPEVNDDIVIDILESDLKIDRFCSSGSGGQNVNKVETAVRITHIPTKISVACQNERSQKYNHDLAMKLLKSKLYELELRKRAEIAKENYDNLNDISWGYQRRSYFLQPKVIVKDHKTGIIRYDADAILGGDIDDFIEKSLSQN
jgi:peptide chain release factor 2